MAHAPVAPQAMANPELVKQALAAGFTCQITSSGDDILVRACCCMALDMHFQHLRSSSLQSLRGKLPPHSSGRKMNRNLWAL